MNNKVRGVEKMQSALCTCIVLGEKVLATTLCFLWAGCPSCYPTNNIKALKEILSYAISK